MPGCPVQTPPPVMRVGGGISAQELLGTENFAFGGAEEHLGNNNIDQVLGMVKGMWGVVYGSR